MVPLLLHTLRATYIKIRRCTDAGMALLLSLVVDHPGADCTSHISNGSLGLLGVG